MTLLTYIPKTVKTCTKCKTEKVVEMFYKDKSTKDGISYICKSCDNSYQKTWRDSKKVKVVA
jgi:transcription elongation factor Elf1